MRALCHRLGGFCLSMGLVIVLGCDGGSPPSVDSGKTEATVKGTVKIGGVPATEGDITFDPANYQRKDAAARTAKIEKDGTYTITTLTGSNMVKLGGAAVKKNRALQSLNRTYEVKAGENTFDFEAPAN